MTDKIKECSDIEGELMRRGGRLSEWLTARKRNLAGRTKLTFAVHRDSPSLVIMFCNCQIISKLHSYNCTHDSTCPLCGNVNNMSGNVHNMKESWDLTGVLPVFAQPVKLVRGAY